MLAHAYKNANDKYMDVLQKESEEAAKTYRDVVNKFLNDPHDDNNNNATLKDAKAKHNQDKSKANPGFLKKQVSVLNLMITDQMNALKTAMSTKIKALSDAIHHKNSEQELLGITDKTKVAGEKIGSFTKNGNKILNNDGSLDVKQTQGMYSESVEGSLFAFEEGYQEFDESAVTENAKKVADAITEFIDKLIEKLKDFVDDIKNKFDSAKTKTVLKSELAKSKIKIKFAFRDKDITKAVTAYEKALNNYIVALEKLSQKISAGKITIDDYYTEEGKITAQFETTLFKLEQTYSTQKTSARLNSNVYEASKVCDYLIKLENYQDKKISDIQSKSNTILNKIRDEARKSADADAKVAAEKKRAAAIATATKKVIGSVVAVVGFGAAYYGICKYADKVAFKDAFSESVDGLTESMTLEEFTEAAMI